MTARPILLAAALTISAAAACSAEPPASADATVAAPEQRDRTTSAPGAFRQGPAFLEIVRQADVIVIAEIVRTGSSQLTLRPLRALSGQIDDAETFAARKPDYPATEPRWASYEKGQRLVFFLAPSEPSGWSILGRASEGELPVSDGFVYLTDHFVEGLEVRRWPAYGAEIASQRIEEAVFVDAIKGARTCFSGRTNSKCDAAAVAQYAQRSALHRMLAKDAAR